MMLTIVALLTAITLAFGLVGIIVRYALVPYLRDQLINPVQETHRQVTVNQHSSEEPTILDKMDDLKRQISGVEEKLDQHLIGHRWR